MPEERTDAEVDSMLHAALGGLTPHQALMQASLADAAKKDERTAAIARNRERAMRLLEALEKSRG